MHHSFHLIQLLQKITPAFQLLLMMIIIIIIKSSFFFLRLISINLKKKEAITATIS